MLMTDSYPAGYQAIEFDLPAAAEITTVRKDMKEYFLLKKYSVRD